MKRRKFVAALIRHPAIFLIGTFASGAFAAYILLSLKDQSNTNSNQHTQAASESTSLYESGTDEPINKDTKQQLSSSTDITHSHPVESIDQQYRVLRPLRNGEIPYTGMLLSNSTGWFLSVNRLLLDRYLTLLAAGDSVGARNMESKYLAFHDYDQYMVVRVIQSYKSGYDIWLEIKVETGDLKDMYLWTNITVNNYFTVSVMAEY